MRLRQARPALESHKATKATAFTAARKDSPGALQLAKAQAQLHLRQQVLGRTLPYPQNRPDHVADLLVQKPGPFDLDPKPLLCPDEPALSDEADGIALHLLRSAPRRRGWEMRSQGHDRRSVVGSRRD